MTFAINSINDDLHIFSLILYVIIYTGGLVRSWISRIINPSNVISPRKPPTCHKSLTNFIT